MHKQNKKPHHNYFSTRTFKVGSNSYRPKKENNRQINTREMPQWQFDQSLIQRHAINKTLLQGTS